MQLFHCLLVSVATISTLYNSLYSRSKAEAVYIFPVLESIFSHFFTSPSKEYLWKEIGKNHMLYQIKKKHRQSIYFIDYMQVARLLLYLKRGFFGRVLIVQPSRRDRLKKGGQTHQFLVGIKFRHQKVRAELWECHGSSSLYMIQLYLPCNCKTHGIPDLSFQKDALS